MTFGDQAAKLVHIALTKGVSPQEIISSLELIKLELAHDVFTAQRENPPSPIVTPDKPAIIH